MPRLPTDGFFAIDVWLTKPSTVHYDAVQWQWRDDRGSWHAYSAIDSRMVEAAHQSGEDEISLSTMGRTYTLDFHSMQQINEETGTTRPVRRKMNNCGGSSELGGSGVGGVKQSDSRIECLQEKTELTTQFIRSLFSLLYGWTGCPSQVPARWQLIDLKRPKMWTRRSKCRETNSFSAAKSK